MKQTSLIVALLTLILFGELAFLSSKNNFLSLLGIRFGGMSIEEYADQMVAICSKERNSAPCYDKEIPKLMDFLSMEDAFKVTIAVQDRDDTYRYCHVLGHELSAREVQKDPDKWEEVITRCPSGVCSNGCLHGGFQERFRSEWLPSEEIEKLIPTLKSVCEPRASWSPTGLEQGSCYHALGHLTMYMTNADIKSALSLCDTVVIPHNGYDFVQICYDGAFMQIFQPLEPEDIALIKGKEVTKEGALAFCNSFSGKQRSSCWTESWPLFSKELRNAEVLTKHCAVLEGAHQNRCYSALIYAMTVQLGFSAPKMEELCSGLPSSRRAKCFADVATRFIETDYRNVEKSATLCLHAEPFDPEHKCYKDLVLYAGYNFHVGSEAYFALCNALPSEWKEQCLAKNKKP